MRIAVTSPKGGVGKTTVVANLAAALIARGVPVLIVDLDPQNALRLHHQGAIDQPDGLAVQSLQQQGWGAAVSRSPTGVDVLPFGTLAEADRRALEQSIVVDPQWLRRGLDSLTLAPGCVTLIDVPPGASVYLEQALSSADLVLSVLLPDAASFVTVAAMERWLEEYARPRPGFIHAWYLVNRMNAARTLCRDVMAALTSQLGGRLVPRQIHFDAAVEEALASQLPVTRYAPDSLAARDFHALADWLVALLRNRAGGLA